MIDRVGSGFKDYAPLILRVGLATIFIIQGAQNIPSGRSPHLHEVLELVVELLGGLFLLIGFMTRWAAFALGALLIWLVFDDPRFRAITDPHYRWLFACLMMCAALYGLGGGKHSIDEQKKRKDDK